MKTKAVIIALVATLLLGFAGPAAAQSSGSDYAEKSLQLNTTRTASITSGDTAWILLQWQGLADITDFELRATGTDGVTVAYPTNTGDHSSFMQGRAIAEGRLDSTALKLTVPANAKKEVFLDLSFTWTAYGESRQGSTQIRVPLVEYKGDDFQIVDRAVRPGVDGDMWIEITYRGLAPSLQDFRVTVPKAADKGVDLYFPRTDHSSLNTDSELEDRETDYIRFRFDPDQVEELAKLDIETEYRIGDKTEDDKDDLKWVEAALADVSGT